jgi:hypothetical protein
MQRRQVVAACAVALVLVAGCAQTPRPTPVAPPPDAGQGGPVTTPEPPSLEVSDFTPRASATGDLAVDVMVSNPTASRLDSTLVLTTAIDGEQTTIQETFTLDADARTNRTLVLPVSYDNWTGGGGGLQFDWR